MTGPRKSVYIILRVAEELRAALDRAAFRHNVSNSEYVRRALETALEKEKER